MTSLPPHIWFVRSNGGSGSYPVTPEGWAVVRQFLKGVGLSALAAVAIGVGGSLMAAWWLWIVGMGLFVVGMAWSAWTFISTARAHTDHSITYNDYVRRSSATGGSSGA
ncbi:MAG: hypothetical protein KF723_21600 [Rhizobiaceae bacterium]|nr:hypothetical protein [Rhizobiaceae bacterium]